MLSIAQGFTLQFVQLFVIPSLLPFWQAAIYLSFLIEKNPVLSSLAYYLLISLAVMTYKQENDSKLQCLWSQKQSELLRWFVGKSDFIFNIPERNNPYPFFAASEPTADLSPPHKKAGDGQHYNLWSVSAQWVPRTVQQLFCKRILRTALLTCTSRNRSDMEWEW